ncbi:MAG: hypothetical protein HYX27_19505 [Acidobacteria bacterium]|nr:hypothetical protein [Acidobacteriota bacterium]
MSLTKEQLAEISRRNGAKSKGPATATGRERCRDAARTRSAAITFDCTLLPNESRKLLKAITAEELAYWKPTTPNQKQLVHELIDINWRIKRIRFSQTSALANDMEAQREREGAPGMTLDMAVQAEIAGARPQGSQLNLDRRLHFLTISRARVIRDLDRLTKRLPYARGSRVLLETQDLPIEICWKVPGAEPNGPRQDDGC